MATENEYSEIADLVRDANAVLFITGAGISTDSGLPTYRGIGGLYEGKTTDEGIAIEEALSYEMLRTRPEVTWKYLWEIAKMTRGAKPNRAHQLIGKWIEEKPASWVLTQNVDGLHAEVNDHHLIEVHGRAETLFCTKCDHSEFGEKVLFESGRVAFPEPPECERCGGLLRPDVVLFGEFLSNESLDQLHSLESAGIDLVISIGTSSLFPYITGPVQMASQFGIPCVEINPEETSVSDCCDFRLRVGCTTALEEIAKRI